MGKEISKLNINGNNYDIKDVTARAEVESLELELNKKVADEANGTVENTLNFTSGLKINGATVTSDGDTVTFE